MSLCKPPIGTARVGWTWAALLGLAVAFTGCATPEAPPPPAPVAAPAPVVSTPPPVAPAPPPPPAPPPILPFDEAMLSAAQNLLGRAQLQAPPAGASRHALVIDPLIDGVTGLQSVATQAMGARIVALVRERYPQYEVLEFTAANVQKSPLVLVGTFTGVNAERKTQGKREAYRICLALADLRSGKLVSKGLAFAKPDGVDPTPLPHDRDSPAWAEDATTTGYIRTCQGTRAGDPIHPAYIDRIIAGSLIAEASQAYNAGRYKEALELYETVARSPEGKQFRVYSGLYLSNWRLGRKDAAIQAFGQMVDQGLQNQRLGVKFLFRKGSTVLAREPGPNAAPYPLWLAEISTQVSRRNTCMEVVGHASPTGPEAVNDRLSGLRAEHVKGRLSRAAPALGKRLTARGVGSRETLVGNGRDDASDALDRRVEFKVMSC